MVAMRMIAAASCFVLCTVAWAAGASPLDEMAGYWTGAGSVTLSSGNTERVKCAVIYKVSDDGVHIKQDATLLVNFRVANRTLSISGRGAYVVEQALANVGAAAADR